MKCRYNFWRYFVGIAIAWVNFLENLGAIIMLTAKQALYIKTLMDDCLGELNFMSGYPELRYEGRKQLIEPSWQSNMPKVRYDGCNYYTLKDSILCTRLHEAATVAAKYYAADIESLTEEEVVHMAMHHVDGLFSYMTSAEVVPSDLSDTRAFRKWDRKNLFESIVAGVADFWILSVPYQVPQSVSIKIPAIAFWDDFHQRLIDAASDLQSRQGGHVHSIASESENVLRGGDGKETSRILHQRMARFERHIGQWIEHATEHESYEDMKQRSEKMRYRKILSPLQYRLKPKETKMSYVEPDIVVASYIQDYEVICARPMDEMSKRTLYLYLENNTSVLKCAAQMPDGQDIFVDLSDTKFTSIQKKMRKGQVIADVEVDLVKTTMAKQRHVKRKQFVHVLEHFLKDDADYWCIQGESGYGKTTMMEIAQAYAWEERQSQDEYFPVIIDLSQLNMWTLDLSQPFLPQYLQQRYGYTADEVVRLQTNYFLFLFDNIDQCDDSKLRLRLCSGEETRDFHSKSIFTAQKDWQFPVLTPRKTSPVVTPTQPEPETASVSEEGNVVVAEPSFDAYEPAIIPPFNRNQINANLTLASSPLYIAPQIITVPHLTFQEIPGDGNCLFNAVTVYLDVTQQTLRDSIADCLEDHYDDYKEFIAQEERAEYIQRLRGAEWGAHVEIVLLSHLLKRPIVVINPEGRISERDVAMLYPEAEPIFVQFNGLNHYDALLNHSAQSGREILTNLLKTAEAVHVSEDANLQSHEAIAKAVHYKEHFAVHASLQALVKPPRANEPAHLEEYGIDVNEPQASPALLGLLCDVLPDLLRMPHRALWPKTRLQLYAFYWEQQFSQFPKAARQLAKIARASLRNNTNRGELPKDESIDEACAFAAKITERHQYESFYRYTFKRSDWCDYLIARYLFETLNDLDSHTALTSPWNGSHWNTQRPQVLQFLSEFLKEDTEGLDKAQFLWRHFVQSYTTEAWQNAYLNVSGLLKITDFSDPSTKERFLLNPINGAKLPIETLFESTPTEPNENYSASTKQLALSAQPLRKSEQHIGVRANREMRLVPYWNPDDAVKQAIFGHLPHGAGISPYACVYQDDCDVRDIKDIFVTLQDKSLGDRLVEFVFGEITAGDERSVSALVPAFWGFYEKENNTQIGQFSDEAWLYEDCVAYVEYMQGHMREKHTLSDRLSSQNLKCRYSELHAAEAQFFDGVKERYQEKSIACGHWYDDKGAVISVTPQNIAMRFEIHKRRLKSKIEQFHTALIAEHTWGEQGVAMTAFNTSLNLNKMHFEQEARASSDNAKILALRTSSVTRGIHKRFSVLMHLFDTTSRFYQSIPSAELDNIHKEMISGHFETAITLFCQAYTENSHAQLEKLIEKAMFDAFDEFMATKASNFIKTQWQYRGREAGWPIVKLFMRGQMDAIYPLLSNDLDESDMVERTARRLKEAFNEKGMPGVASFLSEYPMTTILWANYTAEEKEAWLDNFNKIQTSADSRRMKKFKTEEAIEGLLQPIEDTQASLTAALQQCADAAIEATLEAYMSELPSTHAAWKQMIEKDRAALLAAIHAGFSGFGDNAAQCSSSSSYARAKEVQANIQFTEAMTRFHWLLPQPSRAYLERYLRLGLSPDACDVNGVTLLYHAVQSIREHTKKYGDSNLVLSASLYAVARYLINCGATISVIADLPNLGCENLSLLDYMDAMPFVVDGKRLGPQWDEMRNTLRLLQEIFEKHSKNEKKLLAYIKSIRDKTAAYSLANEEAGFGSLSAFVRYFSLLIQPKYIADSRADNLSSYPKDAYLLILEPYKILEILMRIEERYNNAAVRWIGFGMGSLDRAIKEETENLIRDLGLGSTMLSDALATTRQSLQQSSSASNSWFGTRKAAPKEIIALSASLAEQAKKTQEAQEKFQDAREKSKNAEEETKDAREKFQGEHERAETLAEENARLKKERAEEKARADAEKTRADAEKAENDRIAAESLVKQQADAEEIAQMREALAEEREKAVAVAQAFEKLTGTSASANLNDTSISNGPIHLDGDGIEDTDIFVDILAVNDEKLSAAITVADDIDDTVMIDTHTVSTAITSASAHNTSSLGVRLSEAASVTHFQSAAIHEQRRLRDAVIEGSEADMAFDKDAKTEYN